MSDKYLRSIEISRDTPEPVEQTVLLTEAGDWGVAFRRCQDGLWYNAGRFGRAHTWDEVLDATEGNKAFLLGPNNPSWYPKKMA